jgi:peptidoglycan/LPS O-acetylase OafA/YrhL
MSRNVERGAAAARARRQSRRTTILWVAGVAAVVIALLVMEQVALLYVLATLSVTALLVIVAFADLRGAREVTEQIAPGDDSAAIGDRTLKTTPSTTFGSTTTRPVRNRQRR